MPHRPRCSVFRVENDITHPVRAMRGDHVILRLGTSVELLVVRDCQHVANVGALLEHLTTGDLTPVDHLPEVTAAAVQAAARPAAPSVPSLLSVPALAAIPLPAQPTLVA